MLDLEAIELIKQLKGRYFRFVDTCDLAGLKTVFTDDAVAFFKGGDYEFSLDGWEQLEDFYRRSFTPTRFGMHHGHHPEISVDGDSASGIWYLHDIFINLEDNTTLRGSALYDDRYSKVDGEWKIAYTGYRRLFEEIEQRDERVKITVKPL
jgi:ketosteroid isomerase-like protein